MNSVAAKICLTVAGYRWGSGACYFNENKEKGTPIGTLSIRKQRQILKSHIKVPQEWILGADGYILPESYVKVADVENMYGTPSRMQYFLNLSRKAKKALATEGPAFDDQLLVAGIRSLCVSLFNKKSQNELTKSELAEMLRQLICRVSVPGLHFAGRTCYVLGPFRSRSYHVQADLARSKGERDPRNT